MFICYTPVVLIYTALGETPFASEGPPTALSLARYPPSFSFLAVWGGGRKKRPPDRAQSPGRNSLRCWHTHALYRAALFCRPFPDADIAVPNVAL